MSKIVTASEINVQIKGTESVEELNNILKDAKDNAKKVGDEFGENSNEFKKANAQVENLTSSIDGLNQETSELANKNLKKVNSSTKDLKKGVDAAGDSAEKMGGKTSALSVITKGFGMALKGLGIGLIIKAVQLFTEVLGRNQKVVNAVGKAIEFLSLIFNDLFEYIFNSAPKVIDFFKGIFDDPQQALKDFGTAIKENLIERFNSWLDTLGYVASAVKKLFTGDFKGAMQDVKSAGKELVDVATGVNNSVDRVSNAVSKGVESFKEYAKETWNTASANVELARSAKIAAAEQQGLVEIYDRQAEQQRQLRDDTSQSIASRIEANDKLGATLEKQEVAMRGVANAQIAAAEAALLANNTDENQIALIEAKNNLLGVEAQIEGFRSEQKMNSIALEKEQIDLENRRAEGLSSLAQKNKEFNVSLIEDDLERLQAQKDLLEQEKELEEQRLTDKINSFKKGTQLRLEAELERAAKLQEFEQSITTKENEINAERDAKREEAGQKRRDKEKADADAVVKEHEKKWAAIREIENAAYSTAQNFVNLLGELGNENLKTQKAQALVQIGIDTAQAISALVKASQQNQLNGATGGIAGALQFASGIVQITANIAKAVNILKAPAPNVGGGGGGNLNPPDADDAANNTAAQRDTRVFVVETDISSAQQRVNNLNQIGVIE